MKLFAQIILAGAVSLTAFASGLFVVAVPLPAFYLFAAKGKLAGWASVLLSLVGASLLYIFKAFSLQEACYFSWLMLFSVVLGLGVNKKWQAFKVGTVSVAVACAAAGTLFFVFEYLLHVPVISQIRSDMNMLAGQALELQKSSLMSDQMLYFKEHLNEVADIGIRILPSVIFLYSLLITVVNIVILRKVISYLEPVGQFPFLFVWALIGFGALFFSNEYFLHNEGLKFFVMNGVIASAGLYFLQGLVLIALWLGRKKSPITRLIVYGLIIAFLQMVSGLIILLGLADHWVDFRNRRASYGSNPT